MYITCFWFWPSENDITTFVGRDPFCTILEFIAGEYETGDA